MIAALLLLVLAEVVILRLLGGEATGDQGLGSKTMAGLVIIIFWTLMVGWVGQQFQNVNAWGTIQRIPPCQNLACGFFCHDHRWTSGYPDLGALVVALKRDSSGTFWLA